MTDWLITPNQYHYLGTLLHHLPLIVFLEKCHSEGTHALSNILYISKQKPLRQPTLYIYLCLRQSTITTLLSLCLHFQKATTTALLHRLTLLILHLSDFEYHSETRRLLVRQIPQRTAKYYKFSFMNYLVSNFIESRRFVL